MAIRYSKIDFPKKSSSGETYRFLDTNNFEFLMSEDKVPSVDIWLDDPKVNEPTTWGKYMFGYTTWGNGLIPPDKYTKSFLLNTDQYTVRYDPEKKACTVVIGSGLAKYTGTVVFE